MNTTKLIVCLSFAWAWVSGLCPIISAQESAEYFLYKDEKVWALEKGGIVPLTENVKLPNNIVVRTNGTFQIGSHRPRTFLDGQILGADGMLLSPNGHIEPVLDHVALVFGETVVAVNGEKIAVDQNIQLGTDKVLTPDRVLLGGERGWMRVIDGQLFTTDGKTIPAVDTVSVQQGKVIVQKEGAQLIIESGRSMMMNDGTKVFGDGNVLSRDGQATHLAEGEIMTIEGVVKLR